MASGQLIASCHVRNWQDDPSTSNISSYTDSVWRDRRREAWLYMYHGSDDWSLSFTGVISNDYDGGGMDFIVWCNPYVNAGDVDWAIDIKGFSDDEAISVPNAVTNILGPDNTPSATDIIYASGVFSSSDAGLPSAGEFFRLNVKYRHPESDNTGGIVLHGVDIYES